MPESTLHQLVRSRQWNDLWIALHHMRDVISSVNSHGETLLHLAIAAGKGYTFWIF